MNVDRGQTSFEPEEILQLRERLAQFKTYESLSWNDLGKRVGVPGGTLSQWVPGTYKGDNANVAWKVNRFFLSEESRLEAERNAPIVPGFQMTRTAREITAQLQWAHRGKFTLTIGSAGIGKTAALDQYCASTPNAWKATMSPATRSPSHMLIQLLHAMGVKTRNGGTLQTLQHTIGDRLGGLRALLVVDEAQHLSDLAFEMLRALHDELGVGIAVSGNPTVLTRIQGGARRVEFAQLYSRVSLSAHFDKPYPEDVNALLDVWGVTRDVERRYLAGIAAQPGHLRSMTMVLELATLTALSTEEDLTLSHLKQAWDLHARPQVAA